MLLPQLLGKGFKGLTKLYQCDRQSLLTSRARCIFTGTIVHKKRSAYKFKVKKKSTPLGTVDIWNGMTIKQLARKMNRPIEDVFKALQITLPDNPFRHVADEIHNTALLTKLAKTCGFKVSLQNLEEETDKDLYPSPPAPRTGCKRRPPVVTIMGHVDHGKTTLLDAFRSSRIVDREFGGITQHIGAFSVFVNGSGDLPITFLDTPGHAAFVAMRARGANSTDIVVLVVAADDGVMPQTLESIRFAKEARVPIVVAINKTDKPEANPERAQQALSAHGVLVENYGGDVQCVHISALKGTNLDRLLEAILLQAEMMQLADTPEGPVHGVVLESSTEQGIGKVTTCLVQRGTLKAGDILVAGQCVCRVRTLRNDLGEQVSSVGPGYPVEVSGWRDDLPSAGDHILQANTENQAREVIRYRKLQKSKIKSEDDYRAYEARMSEYNQAYKAKMEKRKSSHFTMRESQRNRPQLTGFSTEDVETPQVNLVVKGDVDGSVEAILDMLGSYSAQDICRLDIVHFGVGPPTLKDLELAECTQGLIYLFNVESSTAFISEAARLRIPVKQHNVIYHLANDVKQEIQGRLLPVEEEEILGEILSAA